VDRLKGSLPTCPPGSTTTSDSDCGVPHETTRGPSAPVRLVKFGAASDKRFSLGLMMLLCNEEEPNHLELVL